MSSNKDKTIDEKVIRKNYGEKMWHLCKKLFPTLLDNHGLLSSLMLEHFYPSRFLYEDITEAKLEHNFKNYIFSLVCKKNGFVISDKTPEELLEEKEYILYECKTEEDIQAFKKYYAQGEELCTFRGGRLDTCYVFFAVKKNVDNIKREEHPEREDDYGVSVISIQFDRGDVNHLSIKNRYNHTVDNPDSTFFNNLEYINQGLTYSFRKKYGLNFDIEEVELKIP